jgi:succinyl-diaminopimelate desuccinylase
LVVELLKKLIQFQSVTPNDNGILQFIENYLSDFKAEYFNKNGVKNLLLTKKFSNGEHLCFAGHIDVVPAGDNWEFPPFSGLESQNYIYGRGTQDMKSGVASMVESAKNIKNFNGTLSILLTSDEEGDAKYGTLYVLQKLKERGELPNFAFISEPTSEKFMGDTIKIGRRGSINGTLIIHGKQGHVAYPDKHVNPVHLFKNKFSEIIGYKFDLGNKFFQPSQLIITDIRGGMEVTNVTPDNLKIMFNIRNSPLTTLEQVKNYLENILLDLDYSLDIQQSSKSFQTDKNSKIVKIVSEEVEKICKVKPKLTTGGGTSDARFFGEFNIPVAEFGVINDRIHSKNERVSIDEVKKLYQISLAILNKF